MEYNDTDLRFNLNNVQRVIPLCDSRPFPEFRTQTTQVEGADGEWFDSQTIGVREFAITLVTSSAVASEADLQKLARDIGRVLMVREPKKFTFSDEIDPNDGRTKLYRMAIPTGTFDAEEFVRARRWTCRFQMLDPFLYGQSRSEHFKDGKQRTVEVYGDAPPAKLVAKAKPKSGKSSYILTSQNGHLEYKAPWNGSAEITLNFERQTAKATGDIGGDGLTTGSSFFDFGGSMTIVSRGADTDISWVERWL